MHFFTLDRVGTLSDAASLAELLEQITIYRIGRILLGTTLTQFLRRLLFLIRGDRG